jgi:hypothetical protein
VFIDRIDGRSAFVYIDPETNNPAAILINAKTPNWKAEKSAWTTAKPSALVC